MRHKYCLGHGGCSQEYIAKMVSVKKLPIDGEELQLTSISRCGENVCEGSQAELISLYYRVNAALKCPRGRRDTNMPEMIARKNAITIPLQGRAKF